MKEPETHIEKITCTTALNRLRRKIPYSWDLNIYRGCEHGCKYCYARYSHEFLTDSDFSKVYAKINVAEILDRELSKSSWKREVINIGGVTDSYQPAETDLKLMPELLRVLIKHKTPAIISTKSDLILRDFNLIRKLSEITYINIASTITTTDEEVRCKIEPYCSTSSARFAMLKEFGKTNASIGLHVMPIIPYLTDSSENFKSLCSEAKKSGVHYLLPGVLYLRGSTRKVFFDFIKHTYPEYSARLAQLYKRGGADKSYKEKLYDEIVNPMRSRYEISNSYMKPMREKIHKV